MAPATLPVLYNVIEQRESVVFFSIFLRSADAMTLTDPVGHSLTMQRKFPGSYELHWPRETSLGDLCHAWS
ncbi:MAG TPA: hypothetical protein VLS94_00285 [Fusibacter sp.]|nr:hypothetical protein [Fusibacter sp.]